MTNVLQLLTENKSINEIAKIINFSTKAIRNNLKICLYYENYWVDEKGKKIKNLKKNIRAKNTAWLIIHLKND